VKKVLIVDDEVMNRDLMHKILSKEGMDVYEAENGKIALDMIAQNKFDLVLMDLMMPVMNGFEAIEAIRTDLKEKMPIITVSATNNALNIARAKELGADDYISKPYNLMTMLKIIKGVLK